MAFSKFILPALALAGSAIAQGNGCSGSLTIASSADASAIQSCRNFDGDITISDEASGTIEINGVQQISGDLICRNATQLTSISTDQLNSIAGTFDLNGLTILSSLTMSSLSAVNKINWVSLPALQSLNFAQGISRANTIYISYTELTSLSGIELTAVGSMDINNNRFLTTINVNDMKNVTNALSFSANNKDLEISFPNLQGAANLTFRNVSKIDMPSLSSCAGDIGFYSNTFESFSAPNLTQTGGTLAFVDSPNLSNVSFPSLTTIGGGFLIANNTNLKVISGFPKLKTIVGALDFAGTFNKVILTSIADVRGGSNVQTTSTDSSVCNDFNKAHDADIIKGTNTCITGKANPETNPDATGGGSSSSTSNAADASLFDPSTPLTGVWALIAALLFI